MPPFHDSDWFRKDDDLRWQFGVPPKGSANFAGVEHINRDCQPLLDRILSNHGESRTLTTLRDTLLQNMLSGELTTLLDVE